MPSDPTTAPSGYVLRLHELECPMGMGRSHPLDYVTPVIGKVTHGKTERERQTVCEFSFQHLHVGWARGDAFSLKALFGCDPSVEEMLPLLFDPTTERFTFGAASGDDTTNDVLIVDEISIRPDHRGRGLGGAVLEELLRQFPQQWAVMVLRASPEPIPGGPWSEQVYARPFATTGDVAKRKLRVYWARFGFRPLGSGELMARDVRRDATPPSLRSL
jgi:GNAT superfamily N-acetyltransferase